MRKKLLMVIDDRVIRKIVQRIARNLGFVVHVVDNGWDAIEAICLKKYDVILVRLELFGMSGLETAQCIRAVQHKVGLREIPILGVARTFEPAEKELNLGVNLISSPLRITEIRGVLSDMAVA